MRIGIFGGAFNPPHIGHVLASSAAAELNSLDLLIVIPTGVPPHKSMPEGSPKRKQRLLMTKNAFSDTKKTKISDIEIFSDNNNYTIDTTRKLKKEYPDSEFFLLVGTDMYDSLNTWKSSEKLLKTVTPVLLPRDVVKISSSELREMLPLRKGREFLSDDNYAFIIKQRLYKAKPDFDWLRERAYQMLDPVRIPHVKASEAEAIKLAEHWGASQEDAREAAILHDITKKLDFSQNMCIIAEHGETLWKLGNHESKLLHSITGAITAKTEFGVSDDVFDAIKWHTTGRAKMSMLEKIIYIADYIEETRDFPGVNQLRTAAYEDINKAMVIGLKMTIQDLESRSITPNKKTLDALNDLSES